MGINVRHPPTSVVPDTPTDRPASPDSGFMISTAYHPYPVKTKPSARREALQPRLYSPSESHNSPRNAMYPHLHASGSPSSSYVYPSYDQYYSKDSWATVVPSSWPTFYPIPPRSSSLPETADNPKMTIHLPQPVLVSDIDTPSSISSHSVLTPSSPFAQHDMVEGDLQSMDFDEFDCDDDEGYVDSDFADEMELIDDEPSPVYGASAPHVIKSTSALEGALGDTSYDTDIGVSSPADRRLSASVPGYPSVSRPLTSPPLFPEAEYPSQYPYTHRNSSSLTSSFAPTSPSLYNHISSSSSLAGAFASSVPSSHPSRTTSNPLPILQPQPIRPIPPIPLADLASSANGIGSHPSPTLSPLPLLCQPVSDTVRYQLNKPPTGGALGDICYEVDNASEPMCEDLIRTTENSRFAQRTLTFCQEHRSTSGSCCMEDKRYSCERVGLPIRWQ